MKSISWISLFTLLPRVCSTHAKSVDDIPAADFHIRKLRPGAHRAQLQDGKPGLFIFVAKIHGELEFDRASHPLRPDLSGFLVSMLARETCRTSRPGQR